MPKNKATAASRADEFKNEGLYVSDGKILFCKYCNCRLEHERKDTVNKHIISDKHVKGKRSPCTLKRQLSIPEAGVAQICAKKQKEDFVLETVEVFVAAGIPLEKLDNSKLTAWMQKHVSGAGDLPTADWMRKKYIPLLREKKEVEIKQQLLGQDVVILADETTDKSNNCVFNILFKILKPGAEQDVILGASCVLDAANAVCCSRAVIDVYSKYEVKEENIIAYVTDSARYMTKSAGTLEGVFGDHMYHIQCWAHKVNIVGQIWQNNLEELNLFVCKVKMAFLNTRKRRHAYLQFLLQKHGENKALVKLFPMPVVTRWNTWFESVSYLALHLHDIVEFFEQLSEDNSGVKYIKGLQKEELQCLEATLTFVAQNCNTFVELINFLEGTKYPTAHQLCTKLSKLQTTLDVLAKGIFPENVEDILAEVKTVNS